MQAMTNHRVCVQLPCARMHLCRTSHRPYIVYSTTL